MRSLIRYLHNSLIEGELGETSRSKPCTHSNNSRAAETSSTTPTNRIDANFFQIYISRAEQEIAESIPLCIQDVISTFYPSYTVRAVGRNKYGHFGCGSISESKQETFLKLDAMSALLDNIDGIFLNNERMMILSLHKDLYVSGNNYFGELGQPIDTEYNPNFSKLQIPKQAESNKSNSNDKIPAIATISQGVLNEATFLYTTNGELYGCGRDLNDYRGQSTWRSFTKFKNRICRGRDRRDHIIEIQCAYKHVLFLTESGRVWAFGDNDLGQCGQSPLIEHVDTPSIVYGISNVITSLKVGEWHNLLLDKTGTLWVFGSNDMGQLGLDRELKGDVVYHAMKHPYFESMERNQRMQIKQIECGMSHSICVDAEGQCYGFGLNHEGQLGVPTMTQDTSHPLQITGATGGTSGTRGTNVGEVVQVSCGWNHTVFLTKQNEVITFGSNRFGQCSPELKEQTRVLVPHVLDKVTEICLDDPRKDRIVRVLAESTSTIVIVSSKSI